MKELSVEFAIRHFDTVYFDTFSLCPSSDIVALCRYINSVTKHIALLHHDFRQARVPAPSADGNLGQNVEIWAESEDLIGEHWNSVMGAILS